MRVVVQRVASASVSIDGRIAGQIGPGLLLLLGIAPTDTEADGEWLAQKIAKLRIFSDDTGEMARNVAEIASGGVLVISQFTLFASTRKGTRPSFHAAAPPGVARPLYEHFLAQLESALGGRRVERGEFGAMMHVALVNDGPVTLIIDTRSRE
ncbi:D-tyrosyl-tRNA(Tyr) deacylase [Opitutaceae bacterium TAV4]|nr:D-tyrosyl-tRNA(Tyr) deacylase [Opitutaceae bacterium TAV4]RRJ99726.1 D-tyrosyl-tRNA(Tyr) deacylase [Opitutaceae bacterium TAV3]